MTWRRIGVSPLRYVGAHWVVIDRHCHHSAFSGYRRTSSAYSRVLCTVCRATWRTRAAYVEQLPDGALS